MKKLSISLFLFCFMILTANSQTVNLTLNPYADVNWSSYSQYKGNYHNHTTNTDGSDSPSNVISEYYDKGYDILSITDHDYTTWPWPHNPGMLAIRGNEYSRSHHMNAFVNFTSNSNTLESGIPHVQSKGGISQINHPGRYESPSNWSWYIPWFRDYSTCVALEVFNQGDRYSNDRRLWDNINENLFLSTGKLVWGTSNDDKHSDSHRYHNFQFMLMPDLTEAAWMECMTKGAFYFCKEPGESGDARVPRISNIVVDNAAKTITITASGYNSIQWIGPGTSVVATGNVFDYSGYTDQAFVRAVLYGPNGDSYTQPFGFETTTGPVTPVADFSANQITIIEGQSVNFSDASSNNPTSWSWSFEGGSPASSTAQNPTVTYSAPGNYNVTLTATNTAGSDAETKTNYITVTAIPDVPVADFSASATTIDEGQSVTFTDLSTNNPTSWSWSFEGGSPATSSAQNPTITYNTPGTFQVSLTATNAGGSDIETKTGYITVDVVPYCTGAITSFPYSIGFESSFEGFTQESSDDFDWTINSGSTPSSSTGPSGASEGSYYAYTESSNPNYPNKVAVMYSPCLDLGAITNDEMTFDYHMYGSSMGTFEIAITTNGTSWTNIFTKSGDQGNQWYSETIDLSAYNSNAKLRFKVTTASSYRSDVCIDNLVISEGTPALPPVTEFSANATTVNEGQSVSFTDLSTNVPTSWSWSFEGGSPATSSVQNPVVTYGTAGTYNVTLTATNSGGSDVETKTGYITVTEAGPCTIVTVDNNNFESGWGIWNDGGSDARRSSSDASYANGTYCVRLRDNTSTSVMTTDALDLSDFEDLTVSFSYYARSMDNSSEDFWLQISTDGGSSFTTIEEWNRDDEFVNNQRYNDVVTINGPFSSNTKVRFRCDASGNSDYIYIDDVNISGCSASGAKSTHPSSTEAEMTNEISENAKSFEFNLYPNPTNAQYLNIVVEGMDSKLEMSILDINGKVMIQDIITEEHSSIDINYLPAGTYVVAINNGKTLESQILIVK